MKINIHPQYYPKAKVHCACGNTFEVGSTKPEIATEICSACHPLYTGKEKIIDATGRVERFKKILEKSILAKTHPKPKVIKTKSKSKPKKK